MILADLQDGKRDWKSETSTNSLTSGPRSPTKMLYSGPRSSLRLIVSFPAFARSCEGEKANIPTINQTATASPVELEHARGVGDRSARESKSLGSCLRAVELDEAVASVAAGRAC